jgi:molybdopterin-containing oxidoreductase family iron-sulfur binding subunit
MAEIRRADMRAERRGEARRANVSNNCVGSDGRGGAGEPDRRQFMGAGAAALASMALAPGMTLIVAGGAGEASAKAAGDAVSSKNRWGMLIDAAKFKSDDDVDRCVEACQAENGWKVEKKTELTDPQWIRRVNLRNRKTGATFRVPMMCQHCSSPPCVDVCPTGASFRRADGIVLVDRHICIGCRYCMMACPYKARSFVHEHLEDQNDNAPRGIGTVEACNMCIDRVDNGKLPACVEAAPEGGIVFGDLNDSSSRLSRLVKEVATRQIRGDLGADPGIRYRNL